MRKAISITPPGTVRFPDATNTGVPAGTILTLYKSPMTIAKAGNYNRFKNHSREACDRREQHHSYSIEARRKYRFRPAGR